MNGTVLACLVVGVGLLCILDHAISLGSLEELLDLIAAGSFLKIISVANPQ